MSGTKIADLAIADTGGNQVFSEQYASVSGASGVHDIYLVFPSATQANIDWFVFSKNPDGETDGERVQRIQWWRDARFGQFIHWGPYSHLAGSYNGNPVPANRFAEWIMHLLNIPINDYETSAAVPFNPTSFSASDWARVAKEAGQKYVVITSKHHDGFSIFDTNVRGFQTKSPSISPARDYDISDVGSYGSDPIAELASATRAQGLRFGLYYSILDWHFVSGDAGYLPAMKEQLRELVEKYDPALLWFDGEWHSFWTRPAGEALYKYLRVLKPDLVITDRVVKREFFAHGDGDYDTTAERKYPENRSVVDWENSQTMNDTWGYRAADTNWKPASQFIEELVSVTSRNGNYLLNIGPDGTGTIPNASVTRLKTVGDWLATYGPAIYGTDKPNPLKDRKPSWGWYTTKGNTVYAIVKDWPADGRLELENLNSEVTRVSSLSSPGTTYGTSTLGRRVAVTGLPPTAPSSHLSVLELSIEGKIGGDSRNLAHNRPTEVSDFFDSDATYNGAKAVDQMDGTRWATNDGVTTATLTVDLDGSQTFDRIVIREPTEHAGILHRVTGYTVEYWNDATWVNLHTGKTMGDNKSITFTAVSGSRVRLRITDASDPPTISEFQVYEVVPQRSSADNNAETQLPEISIEAGPSPVTEGANAAFTLTRTGATAAELVVGVSVTETGSMLASPQPTTATFAVGSSTATLTAATQDDDPVEDPSTITATITGGDAYSVDADAASADVVVVDDTARFVLSVGPEQVTEGGTATVALEITNGVTLAASETVTLAVSGTATADDFTLVDLNGRALSAPYALTLAAGESAAAAHITTANHAAEEPSETVVVTASHGSDEIGAGTMTIKASPLRLELSALSVTGSGRAMYPAFDPATLHYAVGCVATEPVMLTLSAKDTATRLAVNGIQRANRNASVELAGLDGDSDILITLSNRDGAGTTYVVHCMNPDDPVIEVQKQAGSSAELLMTGVNAGGLGYVLVIDANGVPRVHRRVNNRRLIHFRTHVSQTYPYSYAVIRPERIATPWGGRRTFEVAILDREFNEVKRVRTTAALQHTAQHDFLIKENDNYVLIAYEPGTADLREFTDPNGNRYRANEPVEDSIIEEVSFDGVRVSVWSTIDHLYLGDCTVGSFPPDYAHMNTMQLVDGDIVASFRGCAQVLRIDGTTGNVEWILGRSKRSDEDWEARGVPAPLKIVGDPYGEFCAQHSAKLLPNGHLLLFDNGWECPPDPETGVPRRVVETFSRVVEYALDLDKGTATFVRHHSLRDSFSMFTQYQGHVEVMDNDNWLISWGWSPSAAYSARRPDTSATEYNPTTDQELLSVTLSDGPPAGRVLETRAYPLGFEALAKEADPLAAEIAASAHTSVFNLGTTDAPSVVVAFSQPVADFGTATPSIDVQGATIASVGAHIVAGEPANAYVFVLTPEGAGEITFSLVANQSCVSGGICSAAGTPLSQVPAPYVIAAPVAVSFEAATFTATEGEAAEVVVNLSAAHYGPLDLAIPIVATARTASPDEYSAPTGVTFAAGETAKTVTVPTSDDALVEGAETIALAFGALPSGVTAGANPATTVTISDNDSAAIGFSIDDDEVSEGGDVELTFTIENPVTFAEEQTISLLFHGTATQGADFTVADAGGQALSAPYALTLAAGARSVAATINTVDDAVEEPAETIEINATHGTAPLGAKSITILASDAPPTPANNAPEFRAGARAARSVAENTGPNATIGLPLKATDVDSGDTLTYTLGGTDADFFTIVSTSGQLRTPQSGVAYDHEAKASYAVTVSVSDGELSASIDVAIRVTDVDEPPDAPGAPTLAESSPTSLKVAWTAPGSSGRPPVQSYDLRYKSPTEATFIGGPQAVTGTSATIAGLAPSTAHDVQVRARNDEGESGWSASGRATTAALPVVTLALDPASIPANGGTSTVTATVSPPSPTPFTVSVWAAAFPPVPGHFTISANNILSFAANETHSTGAVTITAITPAVVNVTATVSEGANVKPPAARRLTITRSAAPVPSIADISVGMSTQTGATVTVTIAEPDGRPQTVHLRYRSTPSGAWRALDTATSTTDAATAALSGLIPGTEYEVEASLDSNFPAAHTRRAIFTTLRAPSVSGVEVAAITQTAATATVAVADADGSMLHLRYRESPSGAWSDTAPQTVTGSSAVFSLSGLTPGTNYEVQASLDDTFASGVVSTSFTTLRAPSVSSVSTSNVTQTTATVTVTVADADRSTLHLRYRATPSGAWTSAPSQSASSSSAVFSLSGLAPGTAYNVEASYDDTFPADKTESDSFTTLRAPSVSDVEVAAITQTTATVTVTVADADRSTLHLRYRESPSGTWSDTVSETVTGPSVVFSLTGLTAGTAYDVQASLDDTFAADKTAMFTTLRAPSVSSVSTSNVTQTAAAATVAVANADGSTLHLRYRATTSSGAWTEVPSQSASSSSAVFSLSGLTAGTAYNVEASFDGAFAADKTASVSFTTRRAPSVSSVSTSNVTQTTATVTVTVADVDNSTLYLRYRESPSGAWSDTVSQTVSESSVVFSLSGLTAGATYDVQASLDGAFAADKTAMFTTRRAPSVSDVEVVAVTQTTATVTVTVADADGSTLYLRYRVSRSGAWTSAPSQSASSSSAVFSLSGLTPGTTHNVEASLDSTFPADKTASDSFTTLRAPSVSSVSTSNVTQTTATATVTVADADGSALYLRYRATTPSGAWSDTVSQAVSGSSAEFLLTGLTPGTAYNVEASYDSTFVSGVVSTSFTTLRAPSVSSVSTSNVTQTAATATVTVADADGSALYLRYRATTPSGAWSDTVSQTVSGSSAEFLLTGLTPGTAYNVEASYDDTFAADKTASDSFTTLRAPSVSSVSTSNVTQTAATATVTVADADGSRLHLRYRATTPSGAWTSAASQAVSGSSAEFLLSGLTAGTAYDVEASFDGAFAADKTESVSFTTLRAPSVSDVEVAAITQTAATVTVTVADADSSTLYLRYRVSRSGTWTEAPSQSASSSSAVFSLSGLTPGTTHNVEASLDSTFPADKTASDSFTTLRAPSVSSVSTSNVTQTAATATVAVANADGSALYLRYRATTPSGAWSDTVSQTVSGSSAEFLLTGLTPGTAYNVQASYDSTFVSGVVSTSFTTLRAPSVSSVSTSNVTQTAATATVAVANADGSALYLRYRATTPSGAWSDTVSQTVSGSSAEFLLTGLTPGTAYNVQASYDSTFVSGVVSTSFTTLRAPSVSSVSTSNVTQTAATATVAVANADGSALYLRYRATTPSGAWSDTVSQTVSGSSAEFLLTGLTPGTAYNVQASYDDTFAADKTASDSFTTLRAPSVSSVSTSNVTQTAATATVTVADADGSRLHLRYRATTPSGAWTSAASQAVSGSSAVFSLSGLAPGTTYDVEASLDDTFASGSVAASFTTVTPTTDPPGGGGGGTTPVTDPPGGGGGGTTPVTGPSGGGGGGAPAVQDPPVARASDVFEDVPAGSWYEDAVSWMFHNRITVGCTEKTFCSDSHLTRQQFVTFLWRAEGEPDSSYLGSTAFADVEQESYADRAIGWAAENGVIRGCAAGKIGDPEWRFCPGRNVSKAQVATFLYRYVNASFDSPPSVVDVNPDSVHAPGIAWLYRNGIVVGCREDMFCPTRATIRAEAAAFIHAVAERRSSWGTGAEPFAAITFGESG